MKLQGTVPLETGRLVLRRFLPGDAPAVFHGWAGREDCCRYLPWEPCAALQETQVRLENWLGRYAEPDFLQWAVTLRESGTLAGVVNLHGVDEAHCCAETSYALSPAYRGAGLMPEALGAVLRFGFAQAGFNRICAEVLAGNAASVRVLENADSAGRAYCADATGKTGALRTPGCTPSFRRNSPTKANENNKKASVGGEGLIKKLRARQTAMVCLVLFYCVTHYDTFGENASGENDKAVIYPNLFFSPQMHSWSRTAIRDFPRSLRLYSTFGGICGYSLLIISRSDSNSFRFVLRVLSDMFFKYRFSSLNRTTSYSIRQYRMTILYLPDMRDSV